MAQRIGLPSWLLVLLIVSVAGFSFVVGQQFAVLGGANTTTATAGFQGWNGAGDPAYPDTGAAGVYGGILDQTSYIASWSPNLFGQRVSFQAGLVWPGSSLCTNAAWGYRIELIVPGSTPISGTTVVVPAGGAPGSPPPAASILTEPIVKVQSGQVGLAAAAYWDMLSPDGHTVIPEGSVVRAEFWVDFDCFVGAPSGWVLMASDEANVHTGIGSVSWNTDPALYQVGDTATCSWRIGYVSDPQTHNGWGLFVTSAAQGGKTVATATSLSTLTGTLSYKVSTADWAPNQGKLYCILANNLFDKDFVVAGTVDNSSLAPSITITGISPTSPKEGDMVTVNWTAAPNPLTGSPVAKVEILYGWGGPQNDVNLSGSTTSYSFVASQSGFVRVAVGAWDAAGRPSGFRNFQIEIDHQAAGGGLGGSSGGGVSLALLMVYLLLIGVGVVLYFISGRVPAPTMSLALAGLGLVLILVGVFLAAPLVVQAVGAWISGVANPFG